MVVQNNKTKPEIMSVHIMQVVVKYSHATDFQFDRGLNLN